MRLADYSQNDDAALARRLEIYDMPAVTEIERTAQADGYRFSRIIVETVKSYPFRHLRRSSE